jgi:SAM-dependent methyltransferase
MIYKKVIPGSTSRLTIVDHNETYGRHILERLVKSVKISKCADIGCGAGNDLSIVKRYYPDAELFGIDFDSGNSERLKSLSIKPVAADIEKDSLPFGNETLDLIIANQVLEHTKEIFWINHEIFRCLKVNGIFFMGVPNILSLHNRVLMAFGHHPTGNKIISAHVRVFSKKDVALFYEAIGNHFCEITRFYGAQFYPFPKPIARLLSALFPSLAFSSFYIIKKTAKYGNEFVKWPKYAELETNFFTGGDKNIDEF